MLTFAYGDPEADTVLIQPVDDHDLAEIEQEYAAIRELAWTDFRDAGLRTAKAFAWVIGGAQADTR